MRGSTFQRCGCRDTDGKQLGARCPRLGHKGHGTWWFRYDAPRDADGRRRQVKVGPFDSRRDAEAAMAAVLDRINKGTHVESDRGLTFSRYDEWLAGKLKLKQSTRTGYAHPRALLQARPGPRPAGRPARHRLRRALRRDPPDRPTSDRQTLPYAAAPARGSDRHQAGAATGDAQQRAQHPRHRDDGPEHSREATQARAQPGAVRRARADAQAACADLDRGTRRALAADRQAPVAGNGVDARADRRLPRRSV
jgi:hypothetical protein